MTLVRGSQSSQRKPGQTLRENATWRARDRCHMRRYREPLSIPTRPDIGIAAISLLTIRRGVAGARVNDRDISENAHADFLHRLARAVGRRLAAVQRCA